MINGCSYIRECVSNKKKDENSLSYLVDSIPLSQSDCIKLGTGFEKLLADIVMQNTTLVNIKTKNEKGVKEKDHLFMDTENKVIYYAELKANLNLDTEKSKSTYQKCQHIVEELHNAYPDYDLRWCLLGYRYTNKEKMSKVINTKYKEISENVFGINEYLQMVGVAHVFTEEKYKEFINRIAVSMFSSS
jgi:oligoendopeptidase F